MQQESIIDNKSKAELRTDHLNKNTFFDSDSISIQVDGDLIVSGLRYENKLFRESRGKQIVLSNLIGLINQRMFVLKKLVQK